MKGALIEDIFSSLNLTEGRYRSFEKKAWGLKIYILFNIILLVQLVTLQSVCMIRMK